MTVTKKHFDVRPYDETTGSPLAACGRAGSGLLFTRDPVEVDCLACLWTKAYKVALKAHKCLPVEDDTPAKAHITDACQPMETAPKDGTEILVYEEHSGVNVMFYMSGAFREKVSMCSLRGIPTHWQSLDAFIHGERYAQSEIDRLRSENEKLSGLLIRADDELHDMTQLDCPEYVERDEALMNEIRAATDNPRWPDLDKLKCLP